eukprot:CAMPEP_0197178072 /NCGR_PEP_ID=MMETSP1423-20130617/3460_1 /TAXON_ID=476441 /ORGANISM="Pseudo-nitzschia heimii, Strain UNC1101" /LENGTH=334 /DNA_ID=CAMNT_0042627727 /DNA_START=118 /DNA_END=1119 /DNA_ORIENTATION=-
MGIFGSKELFPTFEKNLPLVNGKVFAITGTTSGTGFIAAETVAKHGGEVLLLNRPSPRSIESLKKLRAAVPGGKFVPIDCDLQNFASVRSAAQEIKAKGYTSIYCLSNNAGIMAMPEKRTEADGFDQQIQTNYLSHFLLTRELFPLIVNASKEHGDARIVQHSSNARHMTHEKGLKEKYFLKHDSDDMLGGDYVGWFLRGGPWYRYHQTKLANSVFSYCLNDKIIASKNEDCKNILSLSAHPGTSDTNLFNHKKTKGSFIIRIIERLVISCFFQSAADGSMGLLKGMMDYRKKLAGGTLYGPKILGPIRCMRGLPVPNPPKSYEIDEKAKEMLW